jgi:hypothetical protein
MCYPNDPVARDDLARTLRSWAHETEAATAAIPRKLHRIQNDWLRVADIFHSYSDLSEGRHQQRRGGGSIGKAVTLVEAKAKAHGTGAATLWKIWTAYKDVSHLVTAAALICFVARRMNRNMPFGEFGFDAIEILPFTMAMMMPDLVLAVGLDFERRGLCVIPHSRTEPTLDPTTLWLVPPNINVVPCPAPNRPVTKKDIALLNSRRAGNRGKANKPKTTPVSG